MRDVLFGEAFYYVTTIEDLEDIRRRGLVPYECYEETEESLL